MGLLDSISGAFSSGVNTVSNVGTSLVQAAESAVSPAQVKTQVPTQYADGFEGSVKLAASNEQDLAQYQQALGSLHDTGLQLADVFMKAGDYAGARKVVQAELNDPAISQVKRDPFSAYKSQSVWDGPAGSGRSTTFKNHVDFEETDSSLAQRKLDQIDQAEKMSKLVGHPVDPSNVGQVKEYFDKLSAQQPPVPTSQIQDEYGKYVKNNFVHPGGVDWGNTPLNDRVTPNGLSQLLKDQPKDTSGRTTLDCEGHTYLTKAIFGGNPRFDVVMASNSNHISASVFEKGSDKGFSVNTLSSPVVTPIVSANTPGLLKLAKGDWSKVHEKLAGAYLDGQGQGQVQHVSRDINVVNAQKYD